MLSPEPHLEDSSGAPEIVDLGRRSYRDVWDIQRERQRLLIESGGREALFVCEHPPVLTLGRSAKPDSLIAGGDRLAALGVELYEVERGGDATFHGPGQIVAYPILDLTRRKRDVGWYMRTLERVIVDTLSDFGLEGFVIPGKTGVWIASYGNDIDSEPYKVASIGVRISRWCTLHGLSLNVEDCGWGFSLIHPCGFKDIKIGCMRDAAASSSGSPPAGASSAGEQIEIARVKASLIENFIRLFEIK